MQKEITRDRKLFQLRPKNNVKGTSNAVFGVGRYLVGRAENCDIVISQSGISAIHAVLEVTPSQIRIFDMNSRNGTKVNGSKIITSDIKVGDSLTFAKADFLLGQYTAKENLPPVLESLDPLKGSASVLKSPMSLPVAPIKEIELPKLSPEIHEDIPYIVYPLAADPSSDYSEYLFEDTTELYPIFKYEINKQSVEVIILFGDKVYSVDYLPEKDGVYKIAGLTNQKKEIEFPYLGKQERVSFIEIQKGNCIVHQLHKYEISHLVGDEILTGNDGIVNMQGNDIVKLKSGELEIYIRRVSSPPKVKPAPFFRRDKDLKKYLLLFLILIIVPVVALNMYEVDEKLKDDKDPERIATILYKQKLNIIKNRAVESSKKKTAKKQKAPKKAVVKKSEPKKVQATSQKSNIKTTKKTKTPGSKKALKTQKVKRVKNPAPVKKHIKKPSKTASSAKLKTNTAKSRRAIVRRKSTGKVDAYKNLNFKSSFNNLLAKGGSLRGAQTAKSSSGSISNASLSGGVATNVKTSSIGTDIGSLTGSTVGKLADSKGTKGLSTKRGVYTAGIPSETVVLGGMDPDIIRKILRDNIPFFRSCYQKELDRNSSLNVSGKIRLLFTIGASGHVSAAGVDGRTRLPARVKKCVVGVLRGIKFPSPPGGGTVDVKQPFNFYPKRK